MTSTIIFISCVILSSVAYRLGGWKKSWLRDWLCPLFIYAALLAFKRPSSALSYLLFIPAYGLTGAALTTYFDSILEKTDCFWLHGLACGLAAFPLYWAGYSWYAILARSAVLAIVFGVWHKFVRFDIAEEAGRGAFLVLSVPILIV